MPIYEYMCDRCGHEFEVLLRTSEEKPACPACNAQQLTRKLSLPVAHTHNHNTPACPVKDFSGGACCPPQCEERGCMFQ